MSAYVAFDDDNDPIVTDDVTIKCDASVEDDVLVFTLTLLAPDTERAMTVILNRSEDVDALLYSVARGHREFRRLQESTVS